MQPYDQILVTAEARVTAIALNRPERLNAWTRRMADELRHAIGQAGRDPHCRCIVLTGAGRGFCAGADMGLLNKALPRPELMPHVAAVARRRAHDISPRSMAVMKRQLRKAYHQSFAEALATADAEMQDSFAAPDFAEGVQSFVERRPPAFPAL